MTVPGISSEQPSHCVIVALCGISPAVITETVWGIHHHYPDVQIDELIVITTEIGKCKLVENILVSGVWENLQKDIGQPVLFGNTSHNIRILPSNDRNHDLADVRTTEDNLAMADCLLDTLRGFADNPEQRLFVSLSGGRKTMSAMMGFCFSLVAREYDRLFHVLVNAPFDNPILQPSFFYPCSPPLTHHLAMTAFSSADAEVTLIDIPVVRLRQLFQKDFGQAPGSFTSLVQQANQSLSQLASLPLCFDLFEAKCAVGTTELKLTPRQMIVYYTIAEASKNGKSIDSTKELLKAVQGCTKRLNNRMDVHQKLHFSFMLNTPEDLNRIISDLRNRLKQNNLRNSPYDPTEIRGIYKFPLEPELIQLHAQIS